MDNDLKFEIRDLLRRIFVASVEQQVKHREFEYSRKNFEQVVAMIYQISGINLSDRKEDMVYSRLARRLRKMGLTSFDKYLNLIDENIEEKKAFVNALTTNLTHFFREEHHFDYLTRKFIPDLLAKNTKRIRFWSAGCSTGEEPYTLSMIWKAIKSRPRDIDFKILATDLDTNVIETAERGIYSIDKLVPVAEEYQGWFQQSSECSSTQKQISRELKKYIFFKQLNLMKEWPVKGPFQLIICRNVLIYFDKITQENLINRYYDLLSPGGCLILGHSENLGGNRKLFENKGKTIFRKIG